MKNKTQILKVQCRDEKGLIHKITGVLYRRALNIIHYGEFVDPHAKRFFMRTEFIGPCDRHALSEGLRRELPRDARIELVRNQKKDVVLFATSEHHCLGDLLIRHAFDELPARILAIVSNHDALKRLAGQFKIPFHYIPLGRRSRRAHEAAMLKVVNRYQPDYIVLAKFMRVLSKDFVKKFENRIINIHHSFLPAFAGAHPYQQASDRGVKIIGATAHFVTSQLDQGPIIAQGVIPVDHSHSVADITQAGRDVEKMVLAKALKLAFEDRIFVSGNKTVIFD